MAVGLYRETSATWQGEVPQYGVEGARHGALRDNTVREMEHSTRPATRRVSARVGATTLQGAPATRPGQACDMAGPGLQPGQARLATRRSACAVCAQAGPRVGALCTRPNFDSVHSSESLFVNTVHEHCSRGFQKKNNIINFFK